MNLFNRQSTSPRFELVIYPKDALGQPSKQPKTYQGNSSYKLWEFFERNSRGAKRKKKKKRTQKENLPQKQEADKLVQAVAKYAEQQQQRKETQGENGDT